jgi:hypothetical protein
MLIAPQPSCIPAHSFVIKMQTKTNFAWRHESSLIAGCSHVALLERPWPWTSAPTQGHNFLLK